MIIVLPGVFRSLPGHLIYSGSSVPAYLILGQEVALDATISVAKRWVPYQSILLRRTAAYPRSKSVCRIIEAILNLKAD